MKRNESFDGWMIPLFMSNNNADPLVFLARQRMVVEKALGVLREAMQVSSMDERFQVSRRAADKRREEMLADLTASRDAQRQSLQEVMASLGLLVDPARQGLLEVLRVQHDAEIEAFDEAFTLPGQKRDKQFRALFQFYELRAGRIEMGFDAPEPLVLAAAFSVDESRTFAAAVTRALARMLKKIVGVAESKIDELPEDRRDAKRRDMRALAAIQPPADAIARIRRELRMMESLAEQAKGSHQAAVLLEEHQQGTQSVLSGAIGASGSPQQRQAAEVAAIEVVGAADSLADQSHQREEERGQDQGLVL